jgi:hypothetical protein
VLSYILLFEPELQPNQTIFFTGAYNDNDTDIYDKIYDPIYQSVYLPYAFPDEPRPMGVTRWPSENGSPSSPGGNSSPLSMVKKASRLPQMELILVLVLEHSC